MSVSMTAVVDLAKQIQAEQGCTSVAAIRIARGRLDAEHLYDLRRAQRDASHEPQRRRLVETDNVISVFIGDRQIAGAVRHLDGSYQLTTSLPGRPDELRPLDMRNREQVDAWLQFLGDLAEGKLS